MSMILFGYRLAFNRAERYVSPTPHIGNPDYNLAGTIFRIPGGKRQRKSRDSKESSLYIDSFVQSSGVSDLLELMNKRLRDVRIEAIHK